MKKSNLIMYGMFLIVMLPLIYAMETLEYQTNENIDLKIPCVLNGTNCPAGTKCYITLVSPDSNIYTTASGVVVANEEMSYNPTFFNYSLGKIAYSGDYSASVTCNYNAWNGFTNFKLHIQGFNTNRCPTDYSLLWFIGATVMLFLFLSLVFKWSFLGIISSIGLLFLGFTLIGCSGLFGSLLVAMGLLMFTGFVFMKWI